MKKTLAMILALVMLLSLCACSNNDSQITDPGDSSQTTTEGTEKPTDGTEGTTGTTQAPTDDPTTAPTNDPTTAPTDEPTTPPTQAPTVTPTTPPTEAPTTPPTAPTTPATTCSHDWTAATCTAPKTCSKCGATEGNAAGHNWSDATCTTPKTCKTCGVTEGAASGHIWQDANCTAPKTCKTCGVTEGAASGHDWLDANCTAPKTCKTCGTTDGNLLPHDYQNGVCGTCESREFGYGKWQSFRVEGDTLYIVTLNGSDDGALTGISLSHYQDVTTMDAAKVGEYLQAGAQLVTYEGKSYFPNGGLGDPCFFEENGEVITVHLGEQGVSWGQYIILQRTAKDQFAVTQVVGCTSYGITEGVAFIHQSGS